MAIGDLSKPQNPTIKIGKTETSVELLGSKPEDVKYLAVYSGSKSADLSLLSDYPNVEELFINGDFVNIDDISSLKSLNRLTIRLTSNTPLNNLYISGLKSLSVYERLNDGFENLITESLEYLELMEIRKISDLSFVEKTSGLRKLYLMSLPAVEKLPDLEKMPNLYGLKIYELHKLIDIESLAKSSVRYLAVSLAADKLNGTKIADVLLRMEYLERASMMLDRSSGSRYNVMEKCLIRAGKAQLLSSFDMSEWRRM